MELAGDLTDKQTGLGVTDNTGDASEKKQARVDRRVDKTGGSQPQDVTDFNKSMRSWAVDVGCGLRILEGNLHSTFLWDAAEPLAAAALQANDKFWENNLAKGKAHKDGSVKAQVLASLLHTMTASPPLTLPELKQQYDRSANEFMGQMEELKQLMN